MFLVYASRVLGRYKVTGAEDLLVEADKKGISGDSIFEIYTQYRNGLRTDKKYDI